MTDEQWPQAVTMMQKWYSQGYTLPGAYRAHFGLPPAEGYDTFGIPLPGTPPPTDAAALVDNEMVDLVHELWDLDLEQPVDIMLRNLVTDMAPSL